MTTLIAVYNSEGCVGRCDAKCYEATSPECDCICKGANHGAGLKQAVCNTRQMVGAWIAEYARAQGLEDYTAKIGQEVKQLSLWPEEPAAAERRKSCHGKQKVRKGRSYPKVEQPGRKS